MIPLHRPDLTENESRSIAQMLTDKTKPHQYKECLVSGEHKGQIAKGHLIPRSWLTEISLRSKVMMITEPPINLFWGNRDRAISVGIGDATTGFFTCEEHEKLFFPIDAKDPDLSSAQSLTLMMYKAIISQLWSQKLMKKAYESILQETPSNEPAQIILWNHKDREQGLTAYKEKIEQCLYPSSCTKCMGQECQSIAHKVWHIAGNPAMAVSQHTDGARAKTAPHQGTEQKIVHWGFTVLPTGKGHAAILHYYRDEEHDLYSLFGGLFKAQGKKLQSELSVLMLDYCENIAISPTHWERLGTKRQQAILQRFWAEMPDFGFGTKEQIEKWERDRLSSEKYVPNMRQLNLFRV